MNFDIDYSQVNLIELRAFNISVSEIEGVLLNPSTYYEDNPEFIYAIGFSEKRKFIEIAFRASKRINFDIEALQIRLPYEKDIKESWCGRGKS